jgi:hypothetical protein
MLLYASDIGKPLGFQKIGTIVSGPVDAVIIMLPSKHGTPPPTQLDGLEWSRSGGRPLNGGAVGGGPWSQPTSAMPDAKTMPPMCRAWAALVACWVGTQPELDAAVLDRDVEALATIGLRMDKDSAVTPAAIEARANPPPLCSFLISPPW